MITLDLRGEEQLYRTTYRLEKMVQDTSAGFVRKMGEYLIQDIKEHWSPQSPSDAGDPPAKDTKNLDSSLMMETSGRDQLGRFANSDNAKYAFVRVDTSRGSNPNGRGNYAQALETGTQYMSARPFLEPALDRLSTIFSREAKMNIHARP
jgi:HK97 gp10 family phage protein